MAILAEFFINSIISAVDLISYLLFQILCILSLAVYHVVKLPGMLVYELLSSLLVNIGPLMDYLVNVVVSFTHQFTTSLFTVAFNAVYGFLHMLGNIFCDLGNHTQGAIVEFVTLVGTFIINVVRLAGLSLFNIGKNFSDALYEFITNL